MKTGLGAAILFVGLILLNSASPSEKWTSTGAEAGTKLWCHEIKEMFGRPEDDTFVRMIRWYFAVDDVRMCYGREVSFRYLVLSIRLIERMREIINTDGKYDAADYFIRVASAARAKPGENAQASCYQMILEEEVKVLRKIGLKCDTFLRERKNFGVLRLIDIVYGMIVVPGVLLNDRNLDFSLRVFMWLFDIEASEERTEKIKRRLSKWKEDTRIERAERYLYMHWFGLKTEEEI